MILLNSTIKSKQEVKTASKEKEMKQHQNLPHNASSVLGELLPPPHHPRCPLGGASRSDDAPPSHRQPFLLSAFYWPNMSAPVTGGIQQSSP